MKQFSLQRIAIGLVLAGRMRFRGTVIPPSNQAQWRSSREARAAGVSIGHRAGLREISGTLHQIDAGWPGWNRLRKSFRHRPRRKGLCRQGRK